MKKQLTTVSKKCPKCYKSMTKVANKWRCTNPNCIVILLKE